MSEEFNFKEYLADLLPSYLFDIATRLTTEGSNANVLAVAANEFYKFKTLHDSFVDIWSNPDIPYEAKRASSILSSMGVLASPYIFGANIDDTFEELWEDVYNIPDVFGGGTKEEFFQRLNELVPDAFPLDENGNIVKPWWIDNPPGPPTAADYEGLDDAINPDERPSQEVANEVKHIMDVSKDHLSPLVLDIDGGGIQLVSVDSANAAYFDLNGNDFATTTGWTAGGDGLLAIDLDEDGIINNGTELFGDQTGYGNGFQALAAYDSNSDGVITSADTDWSKLVVWIDANQNGFSEDGELFTLDDLNITEISLSYTDVYYDYAGNIIRQESSFTMNGSTQSIMDAYFAVDNLNSTYVGDYTLDPQTLFLPGARGYGTLPDLYIAMSLDNDTQDPDSLMSLVTDFTELTLSEIFAADTVALDAINGILFRWAGVEDVATDSRGQYIDARKLEFLEAMTGEEWKQLDTYENPMWIAAADLEKAFEVAQGYYFATLVAQTVGKEFLLGDYYFNSQTGGFEGITGIDTGMLADLETEALALTSTQDRLTFWGNVVRLVEYTQGNRVWAEA